jgi:hypothetical protein
VRALALFNPLAGHMAVSSITQAEQTHGVEKAVYPLPICWR